MADGTDYRVNTAAADTEPLLNSTAEDTAVIGRPPTGHQTWKKTRSVALATVFLVGGFSEGTLGPSLVDLRLLFRCDYAALGRALVGKGVGLMVGSLLGGLAVDWCRSRADALAAGAALVWGLALAALPWAEYLSIATVLFAVHGMCQAILNVVVSCLCISLWGDKAATPLHLMHAAFTLTLTISPFITAPFLSQNITSPATLYFSGATPKTFEMVMTDFENVQDLSYLSAQIQDSASFENLSLQNISYLLDEYNIHNQTIPPEPFSMTATQIWIPWTVAGGFAIMSSIGFCLLFLLGFRYDPPQESSDTNRSYTLKSLFGCRRQNIYPIYFLFSLFILYILNRARISCINLFLFPIATKPPLEFSHSISALVTMVYSGGMIVGRLILAALAHRIHMAPLLWIQSVLLLVTHLLLALIGLGGNVQFWILCGLLGVWSGPAYPSIVSWANNYLEVHGYVMAIIDLGIGVGTFTASWLSGYLFEYYGSVSVFYFCVVNSALLLLVLLPLQIVASKHGDRCRPQASDDDNDETQGRN